MSYQWWPYVQFVPANGITETWDLRAKMSDGLGPVKIDLDYIQDRERRISVSERRVGVLHRGFRPRVAMDFDVVTLSQQGNLAILLNRLRRPNDWTVYLSLDGAATFRAVQLDAYEGPMPFGGYTRAGAKHRIRVEGVELLADIPDMSADPAEARDFLFDGSFEVWTSATVPTYYNESLGGQGIPNQETSIVFDGANSVRLERTSGVGAYGINQITNGMIPNRHYRMSCVRRGNVAGAALAEVFLQTSSLYNYNRSTLTWSLSTPGSENYISVSNTQWEADSFTFFFPELGPTDPQNRRLTIRFTHRSTGVGDLIYYDNARLVGPVRPVGVAAW